MQCPHGAWASEAGRGWGAGGDFSKGEAVHVETDKQVFGEQMFVGLAGTMGHRADSGL